MLVAASDDSHELDGMESGGGSTVGLTSSASSSKELLSSVTVAVRKTQILVACYR